VFWSNDASSDFCFASFAFWNIPVFVNAEIEMPAKISKITIVITSATNVIPFEFLNVFFIFSSLLLLFFIVFLM